MISPTGFPAYLIKIRHDSAIITRRISSMQWIYHLLNYALWAIILALLCIPINIALIALRWCSAKYIFHLWRVRKTLTKVPDDLLLRSDGKHVVFVTISPDGTEQYHQFYSGVLTWKSGQRLVKKFRRTVDKQLLYRSIAWTFIVLPLFISFTYFIFNKPEVISTKDVSEIRGCVSGILILSILQAMPFTLFMWPGLQALLENVD